MHLEYGLVTPLLFGQGIRFTIFSYKEISIGFIYSICLDLIPEIYIKEVFQINADSLFLDRTSTLTPK